MGSMVPVTELRVIDGRATEDSLVTTILHAIEVAEACRSQTTVELLKMALLNEGVRLAAYLSNDSAGRSYRARPGDGG